MADPTPAAPTIWGYVLEARGRPSVERQRECMAFHGVRVDGLSPPVYHDAPPPRPTRPRTQLADRAALLMAAHKGDVVVVAAPECLGVSEADVAWFLSELAARGASVIINGGSERIAPGDDVGGVAKAAGRAARARHMAVYRGKKR